MVFNWVTDKELRGRQGAVQLQVDAADEFQNGNPQLLNFVKRHRHDLQDQIDFVWELRNASKRFERMATPRSELLLQAATTRVCSNGTGRCAQVYDAILSHQQIEPLNFLHIFLMLCALVARRETSSCSSEGRIPGRRL